MPLSENEMERYSRQIVLEDIGLKGQLKLRDARVCLVGVGGLGNHIATQLVAMGVGYLKILDRDIVAVSNLHRQPLFDTSLIDYAKVEAAKKKLLQINPGVIIDALPVSIDYETAEEAVKDVDIVVDGLDSIEARYAVNAACVKHSMPFVYGSAITTVGAASTIIPGKTPCLRCIYPKARDDELPKCGTEGVHPSILTLISSIEVSETVKILLGKEPSLAGKLLFCDLTDLSFDAVEIKRSERCVTCSVPNGGEERVERQGFVEICGRERGSRVLMITPRGDLNLDMEKLHQVVSKGGYKVGVRGDVGLTFVYDERTKVSVLKSGIAVVTTRGSEEEALTIYRHIVVDKLGVSESQVGVVSSSKVVS
ncbi:MAG: HesA/MoeB/ThiF family protein [Thaumarchaeota archaeon]|nr:HesA/MoeB/ThiF family protein [Nitrososphaerota archaeon]